jgi:hypothetical protein
MSPSQKLVMARALAELGVDVIETGFPASSQSDREAAGLIARELRETTLCVLSRCLPGDIEASARSLETSAKPRLHVFLSTSALHREHKLRMTKEQVLESVSKHVTMARGYIDDVEFSAEDATRTEEDFLAQVVAVAIAAGATTINLPDTLGYTTPAEIRGLFQRLIANVPGYTVRTDQERRTRFDHYCLEVYIDGRFGTQGTANNIAAGVVFGLFLCHPAGTNFFGDHRVVFRLPMQISVTINTIKPRISDVADRRNISR